MKKTPSKDYVLPEAGTDINLLKNKSIFVDDGGIDESENDLDNTTIVPSEEQSSQSVSYPPYVFMLSDMSVYRIPYTKYNSPQGRQSLNNAQYMMIKRLFNLYPELYSTADDILLLLAHLPNDIRGIATYRILQGLLPQLNIRKKTSIQSKLNNDNRYNDKLIRCMTRYYQMSKHNAEMYIDMLYKIGKKSQLKELLSMYGYDDTEIKKIVK